MSSLLQKWIELIAWPPNTYPHVCVIKWIVSNVRDELRKWIVFIFPTMICTMTSKLTIRRYERRSKKSWKFIENRFGKCYEKPWDMKSEMQSINGDFLMKKNDIHLTSQTTVNHICIPIYWSLNESLVWLISAEEWYS